MSDHSGFTATGNIDLDNNDLDLGATGVIARDGTEVKVPVALSAYIEDPTKQNVERMFGGINSIATAQAISNGVSITPMIGLSRVCLVLNAGSDVTGTINISGTIVNKNSGATASSNEDITITTLSTDSSTTDSGGNTIYDISNAYLSSEWYLGTVTISTTDVNISDMDVYSIAYTHGLREGTVTLDSLDVQAFCTDGGNGQLFAHLYGVTAVSGSRFDISSIANIEVTTAEAETDRWFRLRRGNLNTSFDLASEGIFLELQVDDAVPDFEQISVQIWGKGSL